MLKEQQTSSSSSSFVLFPNPNPLMRSTNIPEPIIHPPGIDPYSFLNPKPHADDTFKKMTTGMAPLDVDPCAVASWTQVITNTTHLTASEHAGGSFTEPLMASNSPAHSETSAPQIMYDVEETNIEIKNTQNIRCDVCNVWLNSKDMFREHEEGKKHLKKLQKLSVSVSSPIIQETPPPVADAVSDHETEKKKHNFLENVPPIGSLFTCIIPDLVCHDQVKFTEHPHREKQEAQVTSGPLDTSLSDTLFQSFNSGTEKVEDDLNFSQNLRCEVCNVTCNGEKNLLQHNLGKKHLKNLQNSEKIQTPPSTTSTASMATIPVSNPVEKVGDSESTTRKCLRNHVKGKKYSMKLQETEKITNLPSIHTDPVIIQPNDLVENPKITKGEVVNPNDGSSMRCEPCGICFTTYDEFNRHLSGIKHKKSVRKTKKLNGHGVAPVAGKMLQDMMNKEGKVVFLEMGKRKANGSLASEDEADVKRKKMTKEGGASGPSIGCTVCNVTCTSLVAFADHLAGQEHSAMVLKQVN